MSDRQETVSPKEAVSRADVVLVAVPDPSPHRFEEINIAPDGGPPSEKYPPFRRILYRYRVEELVWAERIEESPRPGEEIEVDGAQWGYDLEVHELRHLEGVHKITIHEVYEPLADPDSDPRQLLLLCRGARGWVFVCNTSIEPVKVRPAIEKLLAARGRARARRAQDRRGRSGPS